MADHCSRCGAPFRPANVLDPYCDGCALEMIKEGKFGVKK